MIYPDEDRVRELRRQDPHGLSSTNQLEKKARMEALLEAIEIVEVSDQLRNILETIVDLL